MKAIWVTNSRKADDVELEFDELDELLEETDAEQTDHDFEEDEFLLAAEDEAEPPYIFRTKNGYLCFTHFRSTAVKELQASYEDDADDEDEDE